MKFELNQAVKLVDSAEHGKITARSESTRAEPQYNVRYVAGDGRQVESWWSETDLVAG